MQRRGVRKKRVKREKKTRAGKGKKHMKTTGNREKKKLRSGTYLRCNNMPEIVRNRRNQPIKQ